MLGHLVVDSRNYSGTWDQHGQNADGLLDRLHLRPPALDHWYKKLHLARNARSGFHAIHPAHYPQPDFVARTCRARQGAIVDRVHTDEF